MEQVLSSRERKSVVIVDDHPLRRAALEAFLTVWADRSGAELTSAGMILDAEALRTANVIIVNLGAFSLMGREGHEIVGRLLGLKPGAPVVVLSDRNEPGEILAALKLGLRGYLPNSMEPTVALHALTFILNGGSFFPPAALRSAQREPQDAPPRNPPPVARSQRRTVPRAQVSLSARQLDVYDLLCRGVRNKEIAAVLDLKETTVKVHVRQIIQKLGVANRTQAALTRAVAGAAEPLQVRDPLPDRS